MKNIIKTMFDKISYYLIIIGTIVIFLISMYSGSSNLINLSTGFYIGYTTCFILKKVME